VEHVIFKKLPVARLLIEVRTYKANWLSKTLFRRAQD